MLEDIRKSYLDCANAYIPNWQKANKNDLINAYIDNENTPYLRDAYFSAIILRYWGNIGKHYLASKASGFTIEDCYDMLVDGITYILSKRKWKDPDNPYYDDKSGPDKMMNRAIYSSRQLRYYLSNRDKRKANFGKSSLDQMEESVGDHTEFLADEFASDEFEETCKTLDFEMFIESYFKTDRALYGLILHSLYFDDCFNTKAQKVTLEDGSSYKRNDSIFKLGKLVTNILSYKDKDIKDVSFRYHVSKETLGKMVSDLQAMNKNKATRVIKAAFEKLADDEELKKFLCC